MKTIITENPQQTQELAKQLVKDFCGGEILCLSGDLGAGKTTFTQGLLEALGAEKPYTSPTFNIMKLYNVAYNIEHRTNNQLLHDQCSMIHDVYHIDAYRIKSQDLLALGWEDFAGKPNTITIIEWPENIKEVISKEKATWINFEWISEKQRKITIK